MAHRRLDQELVARKLARSREHARLLIKGGQVWVGGFHATKAATQVDGGVSIRVDVSDEPAWASRGAHKLLSALEAFEPRGLTLKGKRVIDAGASTGGFTDVCLSRRAERVFAVDVGYGQLAWKLASDERVTVLDRTNIRYLTPDALGGVADVMVGDLSFISLTLVLEALANCVGDGADLLPMVKPQFEVGKGRVGAGGVVRSPQLRAEAITSVVEHAHGLGLSMQEVVASGLPGPSGNVEYFVWLKKDGGATQPDSAEVARRILKAVEEGPQ